MSGSFQWRQSLKFLVQIEETAPVFTNASSQFRTFLTCPRCSHRYSLIHELCQSSLYVDVAVQEPAYCSTCLANGQAAKLPRGVADCPKCHLRCRSLTQVEMEKSKPKTHSHRKRQGFCAACGTRRFLHRHHSDWNAENNSPVNMVDLCDYCHMQVHKLGVPLFKQMLERVNANGKLKEALQKSSAKWEEQVVGKLPSDEV